MLPATKDEIDHVTDYMGSQAPDLKITFVQKMYSENVLHVRHDVWDVHTNVDRWWVITEPMNLYSQEQFPNMDLALTFHIGLCLRIPRSERQQLSQLPVEPFAEAYRYLEEAQDALQHSVEVADYQAIGVRCREALLAFASAAQTVIPWTSKDEPPKKADLKAWADHICNVSLAGAEHEQRRHLYKTLLESAWKFVNWLTHAKSSHWHDAEAGIAATENAIALCPNAARNVARNVSRLSVATDRTSRTSNGSGPSATNAAGPVLPYPSKTSTPFLASPRLRPRAIASFRPFRCANCDGRRTRTEPSRQALPDPVPRKPPLMA
jgi:hypothetical protein